MSQWTYIIGSLGLRGSPYDEGIRKNGKAINKLPFPDEQVQIDPVPHCFFDTKKGKENIEMLYTVRILSLPKYKDAIHKEILNLLPAGEHNCIRYNLYQDPRIEYDSYFDLIRETNAFAAFKKKLLEMYKEVATSYSDLKKLGIGLNCVHSIDRFTLSFYDSVRDCSGEELMVGFEKLIESLLDKKVYIEDGVLSWVDTDCEERFRIEVVDECINLCIVDRISSNVIAKKTYYYHWLDEEIKRVLIKKESENWKKYIPETYYKK